MISRREQEWKTTDANEAAASVAYRMSEVIAIYPITPSTPMAESCDEWSSKNKPNLWGQVPSVVQMQSEGGVAGAVHGVAMGGALTTTFTASQGLLLMIPNMYKLAGELTPMVLHVTARALATHALSIFGDHSDVMACRQTGVAILASNSVQEAHDMAAIAHSATLQSRLPFMHFFDGFRTSHEINKILMLDDEVLNGLLEPESLREFHMRGLTPDKPTLRGTAQNPDTYFQGREAVNPYYKRCVTIVEDVMTRFAALTGRIYKPFEYEGHPEAERVIVIMGSGAETAATTAMHLAEKDEKVGVLKVRLYRPFATRLFLESLPPTVKKIAVLDRTKEPGSIGEPLYLDIALALSKARSCSRALGPENVMVVGGRYGLGSKEFSPGMVKSVFDMLCADEPQDHFSVGIHDDVSGRSLEWDDSFRLPMPGVRAALFFGLGSDGTVGANKNTIKIIGEQTPLFAQGYFVYDSKKSGSLTVSHLRFGPSEIRAPYLIAKANFLGCHQAGFLKRYPTMLDSAAPGATLLVNYPCEASEMWGNLPSGVRAQIRAKKLKLFHIDASKVAKACGLGAHVNVIMQAAFFAISEVLPRDEAIEQIMKAIRKTYGKKGEVVVRKNCDAIEASLAALSEVEIPAEDCACEADKPAEPLAPTGDDFISRVTLPLIEGKGDELPVSAFPVDGTWPTGTAKYEKRAIATTIPVWNPEACTQCNQCAQICPHAVIRPLFVETADLAAAPDSFKSINYKGPGAQVGEKFVLQVSPADCTGCRLCVAACPSGDAPEGTPRALTMTPVDELLMEQESVNWDFFNTLPQPTVDRLPPTPRLLPFRKPLFEFSGACSGCGQTAYTRTLTQLFGDRLIVANATGCSSIYGGNLPTTPYTSDSEGRGPAWANSLFEDNAEFGFGLMLAAEHRRSTALSCLASLRESLPASLVRDLTEARQDSDKDVSVQRGRVAALKELLEDMKGPLAGQLRMHADYLVKKSVWVLGGDGWAYDIGFGGLDHVLASGRNIKIMVLDTEVYSNTGGQSSKATPTGAVAKFAAAGKALGKKDLAMIAMSYGHVYVAQIAIGANNRQAIDALREAESYDGPSLVIGYGPCQAHGIDLSDSIARQKLAVQTGYWTLFRFDPRRVAAGQAGMVLDSPEPTLSVADFMAGENRFRILRASNPERASMLQDLAQERAVARFRKYEAMTRVEATSAKDEDEGWG
ncbi:MAG: pyruvate:ferredoxin (flavodoxin) oxidoreductase [Opitutales bacterium]|jgi:pyruvate-ferredoxin/flavodoxin oxidoreductase